MTAINNISGSAAAGGRSSTAVSGKDKLLFLLVGGGIGAVVALLFAPKSGADLRHDITDATRQGFDGTCDLAHRLKETSNELAKTVKEKSGKVYELAAERLSRGSSVVADAAAAAPLAVTTDDPLELEHKFSQRQPGNGRRSSNIM